VKGVAKFVNYFAGKRPLFCKRRKKNDRDKRNFHVLIHLKSLMKFSLVLLTTFYFSILSPVLSKITEGNVVIIFVAKLLMKYIYIHSIAYS